MVRLIVIVTMLSHFFTPSVSWTDQGVFWLTMGLVMLTIGLVVLTAILVYIAPKRLKNIQKDVKTALENGPLSYDFPRDLFQRSNQIRLTIRPNNPSDPNHQRYFENYTKQDNKTPNGETLWIKNINGLKVNDVYEHNIEDRVALVFSTNQYHDQELHSFDIRGSIVYTRHGHGGFKDNQSMK